MRKYNCWKIIIINKTTFQWGERGSFKERHPRPPKTLFTDQSEGRMITQVADVNLVLLDRGHCAPRVPALDLIQPRTPGRRSCCFHGCFASLPPNTLCVASVETRITRIVRLGALGRVSLLGNKFQLSGLFVLVFKDFHCQHSRASKGFAVTSYRTHSGFHWDLPGAAERVRFEEAEFQLC